MSAESTLNIIIIENPFDVSKRRVEQARFVHGMSIKGYVSGYSGDYVVSINGGIVEPENESLTYPKPGDTIVMCPVPHGGDGGGAKGILRMVAMVVIAIYAPALAANMGAGAVGTVGNAIASAAITMAGGMLVNAILPPPEPQINSPKDISETPTYGVDGAKNTANDGMTVPLCYGGYRMAGNLIGLYTENITDTQYAYMLINAGEGEISGIEDIQVNDQPIGNFKEITIQKRFGVDNQQPIDWFNNTVRPNSVSQKVLQEWSYFNTSGEVDKLRIDFVLPRGLLNIHEKKGDYLNRSVSVEIQIRKVGESEWSAMDHENYSGLYGPVRREWYRGDYIPDGTEQNDSEGNVVRNSDGSYVGYWWRDPLSSSTVNWTHRTTKPLRKSVMSKRLEEAEYEVRWRRTNAEATGKYSFDEITITDVNEIVTDKIGYNYTAMLALRVKLTDQLNGLPKVTYLNNGIICDVYDESQDKWVRKPTKNPAWIAYDALRNSRYGGSLAENRVDMPRLKEWARWCDDQSLTFRGVLDGKSNLWEQLAPVFRAGHAKPIMYGTRYSFAIEKPSDPVMMFSESNVIEDSFALNWMGMEDRANEIEVVYFDETDDFKRKTVKLYDEKAIVAGEAQKTNSMTLVGVTTQENALYEAKMALDINRYIRQSVSFEASLNAIACTIGSVIYVQNNMPQWGYAGRLLNGSTRTVLKLDADVENLSGSDTNKILVRISARNVLTGNVTNIIGNKVLVDGFDNTFGPIKRLQCNGKDVGVTDIINYNGLGWCIEVDDIDGIATGLSASLWNTDVIEERDITSFTGNEVTLSSPLSEDPEEYAEFMIGHEERMKKLFRVTAIEYSQEYTRKIEAIEYNPTILDRHQVVIPSLNVSDIPSMSHSTIDGVLEELIRFGANLFKSRLTVSFVNTSDVYSKSEVFFRKDGEAYQSAGMHYNQVSFDAEEGITYDIKVVAIDAAGVRKDDEAPIFNYTVQGKTLPPEDVTGMKISRSKGGLVVSWTANPDVDLQGYVLREGASWDAYTNEERLSATSLFVPKGKPGTYRFHVRAIDTTGNLSELVTTHEITLDRPGSVTSFAVAQSGNDLIFSWDKPATGQISEYEIRVGQSWASSQLLSRVDSTSYKTSVEGYGDRVFWIKAIDDIGLESEFPKFYKLGVARTSDRNLMFSQDHEDLLYPGTRFNIDGVDSVLMTSEAAYSEYISRVSLPERTRARNIITMDVLTVADDTLILDQADFSWDDTEAQRQYESDGEGTSAFAETQIALKTGVSSDEIHSFGFEAGLVSEQGKSPAESIGVTHQEGRFNDGVMIDDFTSLKYDQLSIPQEFSLKFWVTPNSITKSLSGIYWKAESATGELQLLRYSSTNDFVLRDHLGNEVRVPIAISERDRLLVAVVQTATERRLMIGKPSGEYVVQNGALSPIGVITGYQLST